MIQLAKALKAWGTPQFRDTLEAELEGMGADLPLQQALTTSSYALDSGLKAMILSVSEEDGFIRAKAGIFYSGIIAGCSCADDPTPVDENTEYCEVQLDIDKRTAETRIALLAR